MFNWYGVTATQLTTTVRLYSRNNNITLKRPQLWTKHVGENIVNEIHNKH